MKKDEKYLKIGILINEEQNSYGKET